MFIDMYSWWNRTAEHAKQESAKVKLILAAHVTGTALKTDSSMLTQNEACFESLFPELKHCVFFPFQTFDRVAEFLCFWCHYC